jgi:hypothetical protein
MFFGERKILGYVHFMLNEMRYSATWILAHRETMEQHALYVTYDNKRWKVTGASRMGDLFLAQNLTRKNGEGYDIRVPLDFSKLTEWSDSPVVDCPDEYTSIEGQYDTGGGWWADIYTPKGNLLMSGLRLGEAKPILDNLNTTYKAQKSDTGATTTPPVSSSVDLHFNRHFTG